MDELKMLSINEKISIIKKAINDNNSDYDFLSEYLSALCTGDMAQITWFELFGSTIRHISLNYKKYIAAKNFGFSEIVLSSSGWIRHDFPQVEVVSLPDRSNAIELGRGYNGMWTYAIKATYGNSGQLNSLNVFSKPFSSREICLKEALKEFLFMHKCKIGCENNDSCGNYKPHIINAAIYAAEKQLRILNGQELVQGSLFSFIPV